MSSEISNKNEVVKSLFWKLLERGGTQGVQFIIQIVLARLLVPSDFGVIAIVTVFILLAEVFVNNGLNTALIQRKDIREVDYSSVFYTSLLIACILYGIMYISSPQIARYFNMEELNSLIRVLSLVLFFDVFYSIQYAIISKKMEFKKLFFGTFIASLLSGGISIYLAYVGYGIWALVIQQLLNKIFTTIIFMFLVKWMPKFQFSINRIKLLFAFGSKILFSTLLDTLFNDIRSLIIGRLYPPQALGYYNRGKQFPSVIVNNINGSIQAVMLPTLSVHQDNIKNIKRITRRSIITSAFFIFPLMFLLIIVAEPIIVLLLTETWLESTFFLQVFALTYMLRPIQTSNLQAIIAIGRSDILLKLNMYKNISGLLILILTMYYGVYAIAIGTLLMTVVSTLINIYPNKILLTYSYSEQLEDIIPYFIISLVMAFIIYWLKYFIDNIIVLLFFQLIFGTLIYLILAKILKVDGYHYIKSFITNKNTKTAL